MRRRTALSDVEVVEGRGRRAFLKSAVATGALGSVGILEQLGGAPPAHASDVCYDPAGFQYLGLTFNNSTCRPTSYSTNCSKGGCFREGYYSSSYNCISSSYNSRHRTCGEDQVVNGESKKYKLRVNECVKSGDTVGYDGWQWYGTDESQTCSCSPYAVAYACNDGRLSINGGAYNKSICMTTKCLV